jgi:hypothetical protein
MAKLLKSLGFEENPFASYVAENEPNIDQYFIRPPYFDAVTDRGRASRSLILFGARGAGKSATRLSFYKNSWSAWEAKKQGPLVVTLDDYTRILSDGLQKVDLGRFISEVGFVVVEAVLIWLSALEEEERDLVVGTLLKDEEMIVIPVLQRFYLSRPEFVRVSSIIDPMKLLNQAWHKRTKLWANQKWDAIANLVSTISQAFIKKSIVDVDIQGGLNALLKSESKQWNDGQFAKTILARFADFAKVFGFDGVTVLIDKVDETQLTNNSANSTALLIYPILAHTQLLEIDSFGWLFFLWDKVREEYKSEQLPVRLDKIANATISWEDTFLKDLVKKRLRHFSGSRITSFDELCEDSVDSEEVLNQIIQLSMKSPRELIRVLDTIIREHDDQYARDDRSPRLVQQTIDTALNKYSIETVSQIFDKSHIRQILRLRKPAFINKDLQQTFKINDQTARNRIRNWSDAGIVSHTGDRPAEGGTGGKPAHEYTVTDNRVRRLLERELSPGPDFDIADDDFLSE